MFSLIRFMVVAAGIAVAAPVAYAQTNCDAVVVDQAHVISDPGKVTTAANNLGNQGATVRVRTFDAVGSGGLDKAVEQLRRDCPAWQGTDDKHWKSTMLVLAYTPEKHQIGAYYGTSLVSRLGKGKWDEMIKDRLVPQIQASAKGDKNAISLGMVNTLNEMQGALARPSTGGGATTIQQAADYGGLWKVLGWIVGIGFLLVIIAGGLFIFFRQKTESGETQTARAQARRARSEAISGILEITDDATLASAAAMVMAAPADKQSALNLKHARVKSLGNQALEALSAFDDMKGENPNENLTVAAYHSNQQRYEAIITTYILPAKRLIAEIERGDAGNGGTAAPVEPTPTPTPSAYRPPIAATEPFVPGQAPPRSETHFLPDDAVKQAEAEAEQERRRQARAEEQRRADYAAHGGFGEPPTGWQRGGPWQQPPQPPQPQVVERVVERDRGGSGSDMLTGIVVGGLLSGGHDRDRDRYSEGRDDERRRQERDRRYDSDPYESRPRPAERAEPVREPEPEREEDSGGSFSVSTNDEPEDSGGSISADSGDQGGSISVDTGGGSNYGGGSDSSSSNSSDYGGGSDSSSSSSSSDSSSSSSSSSSC